MKTTTSHWLNVAVALFCLQFAAQAQPAQTQHLQRHVPAVTAHLAPAGRLEAGRELKLAIGLPLRNREELTNRLRSIYDPTSPEYHHYLTPAQFAAAFGPTEGDYQAVQSFAVANGLRVTATHSNRLLLDVAGRVSNVEKGFHVTLRTYAHPREHRQFYAPDVEPSLDLTTPVLHISGLDDYAVPRPMVVPKNPASSTTGARPATGSAPGGAYMGNDFRAAYVPGTSLNGAGQVVGLLEFDDGFFPQDILNYEAANGLPDIPVKSVLLDGTTGTPGGANDEVSLDIEMAVSMCPGLDGVVVYEGQVTDDILNQMATDDLAKQLSASWTYSIDATTEQIFQQFAAQGQSFFNASGDDDAYVGGIDTPADDPYITIVGGTTLTTTGPGGSYASETVWNWGGGIGTGGGISTTYPIPTWQQGVNMASNQGSTNNRNLPDVALTADNVWVVFGDGQSGSFGGTSCATPLWAAFTALINQQAALTGQPPVGFLNPTVYALGEGTNYNANFHDITTGNNTSPSSPNNFFGVAGYDLCTGWGTPNGTNFINTLVPPDALRVTPPAGFSAEGGVGGPFTTTSETFVLTNAGSAPLSWAIGNPAPWLTASPAAGVLTPGASATSVTVQLNADAGSLFLGTHVATLSFTNVSDGSVQTRSFALTVIKPPEITSQPTNVAVIGGATVTFSAGVAGGLPLNCQWQFNGTNLTNGGRISGAQISPGGMGGIYTSTTSVLTISNVTESDGGTYSLVATNVAGVAVSSNAVLTLMPSVPVIISQTPSQTVFVGAAVQFGVMVEGTAPFTYQWTLNQTNLTDGGTVSGSATPFLNINGASSADIGSYTVLVSNTLGSVTSTPAQLLVQVQVQGIQLVQNGGFETDNFSSWGESGNFADCSVSSGFPAVHSGNYGALLGPTGSLGYLSQTLPTTAGQNYVLSLWLDSPDGLAPNEFVVAWDGTLIYDQTNIGAIGWTNLQFNVTATGTGTGLAIGFRDDQSFLGLDDIQVTPLASADGPPIIADQPANQVGLVGGTANFSVLSAGRLPLFYQWLFDGAGITNATNATLTLTNLSTNEAGIYSVIVSNSYDTIISSNALLTVLTGSPEVITFDDLTGSDGIVPSEYANLTWNNFYYVNPAIIGGPSGYEAGMISPPNVAYNGNGEPATISAAAPFDLLSVYLTAGWNDNLRVEAKGYNGTTLVYDKTYTLSATVPMLIEFNYVGVTSVEFISSGGTPHPGYGGTGEHFVMDNVTAITAPPPPPTPMAVLYSFNGSDGGTPSAGLAQDANGNFYGTTTYGGTSGKGTIFRLATNGALTTLVSFNSANGAYPYGGLVRGTDGNFYGTTEQGGANSVGTVFRVTTNGILTQLVYFSYSVNGGYPVAGLVQGTDGNFYGTTEEGGPNAGGTVFRMTTNGALTTLVSFNNSVNGGYSQAGLVQGADGSFYGTTEEGGPNEEGTLFRMTTNGTITTLVSFSYSVNGAFPEAGLMVGLDGNFYGTTTEGGTSGAGTVFRITTNGILTSLASFNGSGNGDLPHAGLLQDANGNLYGTTEAGGAYGDGTVFELTTNGTLTALLSFNGTNGLYPESTLVEGADGSLYGTTAYGGLGFDGASSSGDGTVFRLGAGAAQTTPAIVAQPVSEIVPVGGVATFTVEAGGTAPLSYLWQRNNSPIPGATNNSFTTNNVQLSDSGAQFSCVISNASGSVTSASAALTVFSGSGNLFSFHGPDGGDSTAAPVLGADGNLYGTTAYGGAYGEGTVFRMGTNGAVTTLVSFDATNGEYPYGGLVQGIDGNFYGTTEEGGVNSEGTVFRMTTNGTLTTVVSFNYSVTGGYPYAGLVQGYDGNFYGTTTEGGNSGEGTVFRMTTNGALSTLAMLSYSPTGEMPYGGLALGADGNLYGTATYGGSNGDGTVFRVTTNGTISPVVAFSYSVNGESPYGGLTPGMDGNLYGTTEYGGTSGYGTVFRMTTNGTLTTLASFSGTGTGSYPQATLLQGADGYFYGTTSSGGTYGSGTVFRMATNGALTNLYSFTGTNGATPRAALAADKNGNLYGTTTYGGYGYDGYAESGDGTIFRLLGGVILLPAQVVAQPLGQYVVTGASASFSVTASGTMPLNYSWQRNNSPIAGATNSSYTTNNVQLSDSGAQFNCLVSNAYGSVTSSNAVLTVNLATAVRNGGFELGNFNGWTTSGSMSNVSVSADPSFVHSGVYGAQLGPPFSLGYLSENIATTIGQNYVISCWLNSPGLTPNEFLVSWNGTNLFDVTNLPPTGWTNLQFVAPATTTNTILQFGFQDYRRFFALDDVSVVPAPLGISGMLWSGENLMLTGSNGVTGRTSYVLMSTNLALPLNQWTPVATNLLSAPGNFTISVTNAATPGDPQQFYILRLE